MSSPDERLERIEHKVDQLLAAIVGTQPVGVTPRSETHHERPRSLRVEGRLRAGVPDVIICADWSKHTRKRSAWIADPVSRTVGPLGGDAPTVERLVGAAERNRTDGYALIAFDAPIGVPASYLAAARPLLGLPDTATFVDWLPWAIDQADFFNPVVHEQDWSPVRPFFRVPPRKGGLSSMRDAARRFEVELFRAIDTASGAKSVFAFDLPGQVGPAAQSLWRELIFAIEHPSVAIWPFDGLLEDLAESTEIIAAEIYPRAAYGTAIAVDLPATPQVLAKTKKPVREAVVRHLIASDWVREAAITIEEPHLAEESEDDFDALMTAVALLRLTLAGRPLSTFVADPVAEGAILAV